MWAACTVFHVPRASCYSQECWGKENSDLPPGCTMHKPEVCCFFYMHSSSSFESFHLHGCYNPRGFYSVIVSFMTAYTRPHIERILSCRTQTHAPELKVGGYCSFLHSYLFPIYCHWVESSNFWSVWSNQTMKNHLTITGRCTCLCYWYYLRFIAALEN